MTAHLLLTGGPTHPFVATEPLLVELLAGPDKARQVAQAMLVAC